MKNHIIDTTIAAEDALLLTTTATTLRQKVDTYGITLDDSQRTNYQRMGIRNETFSRSILDLAAQRPDIVPAWVDIAAIQRDVTAREQLLPLLFQLQAITEKMEDTCIALGIDIYEGARGIYKSAKSGGTATGVSEVIAEIGKRFRGQGRQKTTDEGQDTTATSTTTNSGSAQQ